MLDLARQQDQRKRGNGYGPAPQQHLARLRSGQEFGHSHPHGLRSQQFGGALAGCGHQDEQP